MKRTEAINRICELSCRGKWYSIIAGIRRVALVGVLSFVASLFLPACCGTGSSGSLILNMREDILLVPVRSTNEGPLEVTPGERMQISFRVINMGKKDVFLFADQGVLAVYDMKAYRKGEEEPLAPDPDAQMPPFMPQSWQKYVLLRGKDYTGLEFREDSTVILTTGAKIPYGNYDRLDIEFLFSLRCYVFGMSDLVFDSKTLTVPVNVRPLPK